MAAGRKTPAIPARSPTSTARSIPSCGWRQQRRPPALSERDDQRSRLARISHHFLSDSGEASPFRLTLLGASARVLRLRPALAHGLCRQGIPDVRLPAAGDEVCATFRREGAEREAVPFILAAQDPATALAAPPAGRLLLLAGGEPAALEDAYLLCKQLRARQAPRLPGVTFIACRNAQQAAWCFRRLATAVGRFLGATLWSYSYLPPDDTQDVAWQRQIQNLAGLLALDWRRHQDQATPSITTTGRN